MVDLFRRCRSLLQFLSVLFFCCMFAACAFNVSSTPVTLVALAPGEKAGYVLDAPVIIKLSTAYMRTLKAQSKWRLMGQIPQGRVYKPEGDVLTVEGAHVHEAYLVIDGPLLVGFYLPFERSYSPLRERERIPFELR